jgi:prepilin-type N-terminal cleavage/methylation domain-containing protein
MKDCLNKSKHSRTAPAAGVAGNGFTLIELMVAMAIGLVMTAVSVPLVNRVFTTYKMKAAIAAVNGGILKSRYQAISAGYPLALVINAGNSTVQVQSDPTDTGVFANVGTPVPFSSLRNIVAANMTLVFRPGGAIQCPQCSAAQKDAKGNWLIILNYGKLPTETLTVSPYGQITVKP